MFHANDPGYNNTVLDKVLRMGNCATIVIRTDFISNQRSTNHLYIYKMTLDTMDMPRKKEPSL